MIVTRACQLTCPALHSQEAISREASIQMANWLLAKDQRQHCCPICCLGFKTDAELFVHLKHTEVHKVRLLPALKLALNTLFELTDYCASDLFAANHNSMHFQYPVMHSVRAVRWCKCICNQCAKRHLSCCSSSLPSGHRHYWRTNFGIQGLGELVLSVCRARLRPSRLRPCCCPKMKPGCCAAICRALPLLSLRPPHPSYSNTFLRCCSLQQRHHLTGLGTGQPSRARSKSLFHRGMAAIGIAQCHLPMTQVQSCTLAVLIRQQH